MKDIKRVVIAVVCSLLWVNGAFAQSRNFKLTQHLENQYSILKILATEYVDTLNFDKILEYGIDAMLGSIDPYTEFIPEEDEESISLITTASYGGIGATIRKVDSLGGVQIIQPYPNSPAIRYNLQPGDILLEIDGQPVKALPVDECSKRMRGAPGTKVVFKIKKGRSGKIEEVAVIRDKVHVPDVSYYGLLSKVFGDKNEMEEAIKSMQHRMSDSAQIADKELLTKVVNIPLNKIGYIKLAGFSLNCSEDVKAALLSLKEQGAERLILDLRGNGGGLMNEATDIVSLFVPKGTLVATAKGRGEGTNFTCVTSKEPVDTEIPLMVLVSSSSASSSEIVAGALQDLDRATIVGTRTYGKGLVQSFRSIGYNGKLKLTTSKYYTPSGRCIQIMDYAHRNPDGSVGAVPDSLKRPFKTKNGRTVYDGGGITPDIEIKALSYSRPTYALVLSGILDEYAVEYFTAHNIDTEKAAASAPHFNQSASLAASQALSNGSISLTDREYEEFVKFAAKRKFDHRSGAEVVLDQMIKEAKADGLYKENQQEYDALASKVKLSKAEVLRLKKDEIKPLLEDEIIQKYYYTGARMRHSLQGDTQLWRSVLAFMGNN